MKYQLEEKIRELFVNWAPEYILDAVRNEMNRRAAQANAPKFYANGAKHVQEALLEVCGSLPGYADEVREHRAADTEDKFNPRY